MLGNADVKNILDGFQFYIFIVWARNSITVRKVRFRRHNKVTEEVGVFVSFFLSVSFSFFYFLSFPINPSRPNPGRREKNVLKFLFSHFFVLPPKVKVL